MNEKRYYLAINDQRWIHEEWKTKMKNYILERRKWNESWEVISEKLER